MFKWTIDVPPGDNLGATEKDMREILIQALEKHAEHLGGCEHTPASERHPISNGVYCLRRWK